MHIPISNNNNFSQSNSFSGDFKLTDKRRTKQDKKWQATREASHNIDSRIVDIVRFLARRSAEQDYRRYLSYTTSLSPKSDLES